MKNTKSLRLCGLLLCILAAILMAATAVQAQGREVKFSLVTAGGAAEAVFRPIIEEFNKIYAGKYRCELATLGQEQLREVTLTSGITKTAVHDVYSILNLWSLDLLPYMEPLEPYMRKYGPFPPEDIAKNWGPLVQDYWYKGQLVAFPMRSGTTILYYRSDWMKEAGLGVPNTHEEMLQAARKLTRDTNGDGKIDRYGMHLKMQSANWSIETFAAHFMPFGGRFLTEDLTEASPTLKGPVAEKAMQLMKSLWDEKLTPDPLNWTYSDMVAAFQTGRLAMADESSQRALLIEDPSVSVSAGKMGYSMLYPKAPKGPNPPTVFASMWGFGISRYSEPAKKEAAYHLLEYMSRYDVQKRMALENANGPCWLTLFRDPDFLRVNPAAPAILDTYTRGTGIFTPVPQAGDITLALHEEFQAMITGRITIKKAAQNMYDRVMQLLKH